MDEGEIGLLNYTLKCIMHYIFQLYLSPVLKVTSKHIIEMIWLNMLIRISHLWFFFPNMLFFFFFSLYVVPFTLYSWDKGLFLFFYWLFMIIPHIREYDSNSNGDYEIHLWIWMDFELDLHLQLCSILWVDNC